ncbi:hypothetical protein DM806_20205 [Sphingobium lactosutens]|uniref:hypothetical protein n=1 Tax=Sphingobium lactosutens TaxID=522773 RepID=UPI0015BAD7A8|nr:hypothetical protein [Sphingobium lactosutens]NWK97939.1 hypothetical protein [Sphingobium lactosutens]
MSNEIVDLLLNGSAEEIKTYSKHKSGGYSIQHVASVYQKLGQAFGKIRIGEPIDPFFELTQSEDDDGNTVWEVAFYRLEDMSAVRKWMQNRKVKLTHDGDGMYEGTIRDRDTAILAKLTWGGAQ